MREFVITVNGTSYQVQVEEIGATVPVAAPTATPAAAPIAAPAPAPAPAAKPAAPVSQGAAGSEKILAPMPGNILDVKVKPGDKVTSGQTLCILEAMKMENEIQSPKDGVIATVSIAKGSTVGAGDVIITMS